MRIWKKKIIVLLYQEMIVMWLERSDRDNMQREIRA